MVLAAAGASLAGLALFAAGAALDVLFGPGFTLNRRNGTALLAILVFAGTYFVIAIGKLPGFQLDRAGAALLGASLMVGLGVLSLDDAYRAIDLDTITLLLGMMIVVANLRLSGFFRVTSDFVVARATRPLLVLIAIVMVSGLFSAFLVNDAVCLVLTPLVLDLVRRLQRDPVPYLMAIPLASNIGGAATITGNPQNMMIGAFSRIPYRAFAGALWPVALFGLLSTILLIALVYRHEFLTRERLPEITPPQTRYRSALMLKSVAVTAVMMVLFFAGQPVAKVAIVGGAFLLLTRKVKSEKVYREIDWPLLLMFVGLFVVVAGLEKAVITPDFVAAVGGLDLDAPATLSLITAGLSNVVSNVPAVLVLKPFVSSAADPQKSWLVVAMASTLAGNFTLVGSVANLIVAQKAKAGGVDLGFWPHFKLGAPLTLATICFGVWWL
ncbi:SLC13 family permease [Methylocystis echinoides]|uniref:SLC13 family permease n=1 Tax=Methylocystis echinoides TaxID=29468 RepID=UPI0038620B98